MRSNFPGPVNIGSEEMVTINQLADVIMDVAGKYVEKRHISGPMGVRGRNSDNRLIKKNLDWAPTLPLANGIEQTFVWIEAQVRSNRRVI
jgi:nucleoside-diphosphate-sugar epimerase